MTKVPCSFSFRKPWPELGRRDRGSLGVLRASGRTSRSMRRSCGRLFATLLGLPMVISHKHRYLFVEIPNTGSTAISAELRRHYDGEPVLHKHATYGEFLRLASRDQRTYFVFGTVRNPLDLAVTEYFKLKTNH